MKKFKYIKVEKDWKSIYKYFFKIKSYLFLRNTSIQDIKAVEKLISRYDCHIDSNIACILFHIWDEFNDYKKLKRLLKKFYFNSNISSMLVLSEKQGKKLINRIGDLFAFQESSIDSDDTSIAFTFLGNSESGFLDLTIIVERKIYRDEHIELSLAKDTILRIIQLTLDIYSN